MPAPIKFTLTHDAAAVVAHLEQFPAAMARAIARAMDLENELTVGHIQEQKLSSSGPTTLGVRSGRLRRSPRPSKATVSGDTIESSIGSNVAYAGAHEFGFKGTVTVRAHRAQHRALDVYQVRGGRQVRGWELIGAGGRGKRVAQGFVTVRQHTMKMNIPARAPIQTGIRERGQNYSDSISGAIVGAWEDSS